jgi:hypothetical protein
MATENLIRPSLSRRPFFNGLLASFIHQAVRVLR